MSHSKSLGDLQQLTMLAVERLGGEAFGDRIREELLAVAERDVAVSTVYVTLVRLEEQGLVASVMVPTAPGVGGRPKRRFRVTAEGRDALAASRDAFSRMWSGIEWA